jgi:hypothetical protein
MNRFIRSLIIAGLSLLAVPSALDAQTKYPTGVTIWEPGAQIGYTLFVRGDGVGYLIRMGWRVEGGWSALSRGSVARCASWRACRALEDT